MYSNMSSDVPVMCVNNPPLCQLLWTVLKGKLTKYDD